MRRFPVLLTTLTFALSGLVASPASTAQIRQVLASAVVPSSAIAIPATFGANVQSTDPYAYFTSVSCPSAGNCVAAGSFRNPVGGYVAFTQTQTNGSWETAIPATFGAGVQNTRPEDRFTAISCSSAGNCVAAGQFINAANNQEAFTQTQTNGIWATAIPATFGEVIQNTRPQDFFSSVSCPSAGNCVAAGNFVNAEGGYEAFTQTQTNGSWAIAIPAEFGAGVQNASPSAYFDSVSCASVGNCVAAGAFRNPDDGYQFEAFTQTQTNGSWAVAIPATFEVGVQRSSPYGYFQSVSCPSAGNCVAAGNFVNAANNQEAFTQTQTNGIWATAIPTIFGEGIQNARSSTYFYSISCSSVGNCVAAGEFKNAAGYDEAFTQTQTNGTWATAIPASFGSSMQSTSPNDEFVSVSCSSVGICVAAGKFENAAGFDEAFTQTQTNGIWATAIPATFGSGIQSTSPYDSFQSVSCSSLGKCVAAGLFKNAAGFAQAFTQTITDVLATPEPTPSATPEPTPLTTTKTLKARITFDAMSAKLSTKEKKKLLRSIANVKSKTASGVVVGYVQSYGSSANEKKLSTARARAVAKFLNANGVKVRLVAKGKGALNDKTTSRKAVLTLRYVE